MDDRNVVGHVSLRTAEGGTVTINLQKAHVDLITDALWCVTRDKAAGATTKRRAQVLMAVFTAAP